MSFKNEVIRIIKSIKPGKVMTYGLVAELAGNPQGARQVVWILRAYWEKENLPWHRLINSKGSISLAPGQGYEQQRELLEQEGIVFNDNDRIDLRKFVQYST